MTPGCQNALLMLVLAAGSFVARAQAPDPKATPAPPRTAQTTPAPPATPAANTPPATPPAPAATLAPAELRRLADLNGDGQLSPDELAAVRNAQQTVFEDLLIKFPALAKQLDTDGDGQLSAAEKAEGLRQLHTPPAVLDELQRRYDKDGDGQLSPNERQAMMAEIQQRQGPTGTAMPATHWQARDLNGDGQIDAREQAIARDALRGQPAPPPYTPPPPPVHLEPR